MSATFRNLNFLRFVFLFTLTLFCNLGLKAQAVVDTFNLPAGYTPSQLGNRNLLMVDSANNVWVGFKRIGLGRFDGSGWTMYDTTNSLPSQNVLSLAFSGAKIWVGTDSGLVFFNGITWTTYDSSNSGLTSNYVKSLCVKGNNVWVGTLKGVYVFDGINWTNYTTSNSGLASDTVNCFTKTGNDTLWIGTDNGLSKYFNGAWQNFQLSYHLKIFKLVADAVSNIWMQTQWNSSSNPSHYYILRNDSITSMHEFYSYCDPYFERNLVGLNSYGNVVTTGDPFEIRIDPLVAWTGGVNVSIISVADLDLSNRIWYLSYPINNSKLLRADYHNSLQPFPTNDDCPVLNVNQVQARIWNNGSLFWDLVGNAQYEVPRHTGIHSIFADGFWIGGLDASNGLHIAAQTYRQSGADFWPGPLDTTNATIDSATTSNYNRIWKVNRTTVDEFINQYHAGNVSNGSYTIPEIILNWPAHGSGNYSRKLAPFIDYNNDGVYNPNDGDYPDLKGDQMIWFVFNDAWHPHQETNGASLGVEIQCTAYAYNCPYVSDTNQSINYTTFFNYKILNRSDTAYSQVYISKYTDTDLGQYLDDRVGCDTILNIAYSYNGDNNDEWSGLPGYGLNPPMQNVLYLSDVMSHFLYYNGDFSVMGPPVTPVHYYEFMQSLWKDSSHVTFGGNGHGAGPGATNLPTNYFFSGNPYDTISTSVWNETNAGYNPDDRRLLTSIGPFNLPAHSEKDFDMAYVWTRDSEHPNGLTTSWAKNVHDILKVKEWYASGNYPCNNRYVDTSTIASVDTFSFNLFPNPTKDNLTILVTDKNNDPYSLEISDVLGRKILNQAIVPNTKNTIFLENFSYGIYFVRISNEENSAVKKFIVQ